MKLKNTKVVRVVKAPDLRIDEGDSAGNYLLNFFKDLDWNPDKQTLDPTKVRTTKAVYDSLCAAISSTTFDSSTVGALMVHAGPGVNDEIPVGKVYLLEGWVKDD